MGTNNEEKDNVDVSVVMGNALSRHLNKHHKYENKFKSIAYQTVTIWESKYYNVKGILITRCMGFTESKLTCHIIGYNQYRKRVLERKLVVDIVDPDMLDKVVEFMKDDHYYDEFDF